MYRGAMQAILSELVRQDRLLVVDSLEIAEPRTAVLLGKLSELGFETGLIVTNELDENVYLASRNVPGVYTVDVSGIDPVGLVAADKVIMTVDAVEKIQEWLG
jgi:large subunit ribosomal protein L4